MEVNKFRNKTLKIKQNLKTKEWDWLIGHTVEFIRYDENNELKVMLTDVSPGMWMHNAVFNVLEQEIEIVN